MIRSTPQPVSPTDSPFAAPYPATRSRTASANGTPNKFLQKLPLSGGIRRSKTPLAKASDSDTNIMKPAASHALASLKKSEGIMNLEQASHGSPVARRHATRSTVANTARRPISMYHPRTSVVQQVEFGTPGPASKIRRQISIENFLPAQSRDSPFGTPQPIQNPSIHLFNRKAPQRRHPLSQAQNASATPSASSSASSIPSKTSVSSNDKHSFFTPQNYKLVKPFQAAFMSTGLLSKRNRPPAGKAKASLPPDTPCKRPAPFGATSTSAPATSPLGGSKSGHNDDLMLDVDHDTSFTRSVRSSSSELELPPTPTKGLFAGGRVNRNWRDLKAITVYSYTPEHNSDDLKTPVNTNKRFDPPDPSSLSISGHTTPVAVIPPLVSPPRGGAFEAKFQFAELAGSGQFSEVYVAQEKFGNTKYAVKKRKHPFFGAKDRLRCLEEVEILKHLGQHDHIVHLYDSWEQDGRLFIQTEYCDNGNLEDFLQEYGRHARLDEFRVWKVLTEITLGLQHIHDNGVIHLDLKPANIFITFEGTLKIGDFGMATKWPAPRNIEREGDREYIAPEILSCQQYDKPADIFSLGLIMLEIAANIVLPENGLPWQKLRSGDLSDAPRLSASDDGSNSHFKVIVTSHSADARLEANSHPKSYDQGGLDRMVRWMLHPDPRGRPAVSHILGCSDIIWIDARRQAGAIIYEGDWGPEPRSENKDMLNNQDDQDWRMQM
ncbi:Mitosis inhibitor protein kinase wee1 [Neolecta irregularis DAH-3]|uniref:Mitosis inhibitor protein kinase wee1 n=1 Tax=Neolecta irregularis (strain DAH-3) TaxID=1198029 RepID=A0A1U7LHN2_NEOID|nr:Mitosis inhibitor protein kinase wee1 [Neolecta irregularis DAH-3]|eukprot:OLL22103.1 Mitosis inhibitor protein kinase wee1 [Neolecta irregularis DAH-3]